MANGKFATTLTFVPSPPGQRLVHDVSSRNARHVMHRREALVEKSRLQVFRRQSVEIRRGYLRFCDFGRKNDNVRKIEKFSWKNGKSAVTFERRLGLSWGLKESGERNIYHDFDFRSSPHSWPVTSS